jgi:putative ATPase
MKKLGYGKDYKYSHDYPGHFAKQEFLPRKISKTRLYDPAQNPSENKIRDRLRRWWTGWYKY